MIKLNFRYRIVFTLLALSFGLRPSVHASDIVLENKILKVVFNENGSVRNLTSKLTGWEIEQRPELALSFSMNVPLPDQRFNPIRGNNQKQVRAEINEKEKKVTFIWKRLVSEKGGELKINFKGTAQLTEKGLVFTAEVDNQSPYTVETLRWPQLGDLSIPDKKEQFSQIGIDYAGMNKLELFPKFQNQPGYFAVDNPMQWMETPYTPFSLIGNEKEGLYVGYHDTTSEDLLQFKAELKPGYVSYELWDTGVNPVTDTIAGQAARIEFATVHFPFVNSGETKKLKPVVMQPYQGTWHKGADIYKQWRATWFKSHRNPQWLSDVNSWQQIHMNNPEDDIRYRYNDLLSIGRECAANGVKAIQVTGWNKGGQDRENPSHVTDPRLGTWDELRIIISEIQKMGVKVVLFTKFTWVDRTTDWYKNELYKYTTKDPYGESHFFNGYAYQTDVQLAEINTRHFSPMCHLASEWRNLADKEFKKTLDLGADGMLFDENQHHGGARYCFDKLHGHKVPAHIFAGDEVLAKGFETIKNKINPDYIFAGEGHYDLEFRQYQLSYFRIDLDHVPIHRYVAPDEQMMIAISGYNDRNMINSALMYRYIISYEPRNFKGRLSEFPMTLAYGKKVDSLRRKYRNFLWNGEFHHTVGAEVFVKGKLYDQYALFTDKATGKRAVVISNEDYGKAIDAKIEFEGNHLQLYLVTPEHQEAVRFKGLGTIPPNSALVVFEK
jgi:hypothetical protein